MTPGQKKKKNHTGSRHGSELQSWRYEKIFCKQTAQMCRVIIIISVP